MKKYVVVSILLISALVSSVCSFSACSIPLFDSNLPKGTKSVSFADIDKQSASWQKIYNELVSPSPSSNMTPGQFEAQVEQLYALDVNDKDNHISADLFTKSQLPTLQVKDNLVTALLKNNWNSSIVSSVLGHNDNVFRMYQQYFAAGINVKVLNNKVINIVYNDKYTEQICNGIGMKSNKSDIVSALGQPDFENTSLQLFGYKTSQLYLFFTGDQTISQISIYPRNISYDKNTLVTAMNAFKNSKTLSFYDDLKRLWPDYSADIGYSSEDILGYDSRGVYVQYDEYSRALKIDIYGNFNGALTKDVTMPDGNANQLSAADQSIFTLHPNVDSIFCDEVFRILVNQVIQGKAKIDYFSRMAFGDTATISPDKTQALYVVHSSSDNAGECNVYISSLTGKKPDIELCPYWDMKVTWIDSNYLSLSSHYSNSDNISYIYDIQHNKIIPLPASIFGNDFNIVAVKNDTVYYTLPTQSQPQIQSQ